MLRSLTIENFRCFQRFKMQQLGRVNLLVGKNNSGKTSILEAIQILHLLSNPQFLEEILINRGEYILEDESTSNYKLDISHLFYNHDFDLNSSFSISGNDKEGVTFQKSLAKFRQSNLLESKKFDEVTLPSLFITLHDETGRTIDTPLISGPLISENYLSSNQMIWIINETSKTKIKTQFLTSSSFTAEKMFELFEEVVLKPEEDLVVEALQLIEAAIQRLALVGRSTSKQIRSRGNFIVKLSHQEKPIPIGSMGDGIWRILGLALAIVNARDGVLLVDEIDTGLHFSTMSDMWKLIWETAKRLNVQVFATTHNSDCWTSLAALANAENPSEEGITIQRIEKGQPESVVFTERQVAIAAERGIEVR